MVEGPWVPGGPIEPSHNDRYVPWLRLVCRPPAPLPADLDEFLAATTPEVSAAPSSFGRAVVGALRADRLGFAFVHAYRAALSRLVPGQTAACLCVTEEGGAAPRAIQTTLEPTARGFRIRGDKRWSTLAGRGEVLLVAASTGWVEGRNRLRLVAVPADAPGVTRTAMPPTPFAPEIPHYRVSFRDVEVPSDALLPGDGYARYVKPFRTVEDIHVTGAAVAFVAAWTQRSHGDPAPLLPPPCAPATLAEADPSAPATHLALGALLDTLPARLDGAEEPWPEPVREAWLRDRPLLQIAGRARAMRTARARERLT